MGRALQSKVWQEPYLQSSLVQKYTLGAIQKVSRAFFELLIACEMMLYRSSYLKTNNAPRKPGNRCFGTELHLGMGLLVPNSKWLKSLPGHVFIFDRKIVCLYLGNNINLF